MTPRQSRAMINSAENSLRQGELFCMRLGQSIEVLGPIPGNSEVVRQVTTIIGQLHELREVLRSWSKENPVRDTTWLAEQAARDD
jgi:hypothetical protein